jgi:hypothetical protein
VPKPVSISTPNDFIELVRLLRILEARLFAWSATDCLSYPDDETCYKWNIGKSHHKKKFTLIIGDPLVKEDWLVNTHLQNLIQCMPIL